jgi:spermidine/putrescine-binding protein
MIKEELRKNVNQYYCSEEIKQQLFKEKFEKEFPKLWKKIEKKMIKRSKKGWPYLTIHYYFPFGFSYNVFKYRVELERKVEEKGLSYSYSSIFKTVEIYW